MTSAVLDSPETRAPASDFASLSARVDAAGLLRRRPLYYTFKVANTVGLFAAGWIAFAWIGASWWTLAVAALLAFASTQVAFLGHDFGHRQCFRTRRASEVAGMLVGNLGVGMSFGWWISKHSRHHANPNHEDHERHRRIEAALLLAHAALYLGFVFSVLPAGMAIAFIAVHPWALRALHGTVVRAQSQRHAHHHRRGSARLPA